VVKLRYRQGGTRRSPSKNLWVSKHLLLDSHAFLWAVIEPEQFTAKTRRLLANETTELYLSAATVWELLIKARKKVIDPGGDPASQLKNYCSRLQVIQVAVSAQHLYRAFTLEGLHKDPFDRLLIAQAQTEKLALVTRDRTIEKYNVEVIW